MVVGGMMASSSLSARKGPVRTGRRQGFFGVPMGALERAGAANLQLAGRVIGSDADVYGSVRVMGTSSATGQASGVCAALPANGAGRARSNIRDELLRQGAIL